MSANQEAGRRWHAVASGVVEDPDEVPLSDDYRFVGPPMSFSNRDSYLGMMASGGAAWMNGGGPVEVVAQYGDGEWVTSVLTFHSATSDRRITLIATSHVVDGEVVEDFIAYDPRVAYNQVEDLQARLDDMLGNLPGATYGLP